MKRFSSLLLVVSLVVVFGCAQEKPEAAAQKIFERQLAVAAHEGVEMDPSGLDYDIVEEGEGRAVVAVTGLMPVKATLPLVKQQGKWVLDMPAEVSLEGEPAAH
jgi:hypothetical protein